MVGRRTLRSSSMSDSRSRSDIKSESISVSGLDETSISVIGGVSNATSVRRSGWVTFGRRRYVRRP
jgi:hypothetical protein